MEAGKMSRKCREKQSGSTECMKTHSATDVSPLNSLVYSATQILDFLAGGEGTPSPSLLQEQASNVGPSGLASTDPPLRN